MFWLRIFFLKTFSLTFLMNQFIRKTCRIFYQIDNVYLTCTTVHMDHTVHIRNLTFIFERPENHFKIQIIFSIKYSKTRLLRFYSSRVTLKCHYVICHQERTTWDMQENITEWESETQATATFKGKKVKG